MRPEGGFNIVLVTTNVELLLIKVRRNNYTVCFIFSKNAKKIEEKNSVLRRFEQFQEKHDTKRIFLKYYFIITWQTYSKSSFAEPCVPLLEQRSDVIINQ